MGGTHQKNTLVLLDAYNWTCDNGLCRVAKLLYTFQRRRRRSDGAWYKYKWALMMVFIKSIFFLLCLQRRLRTGRHTWYWIIMMELLRQMNKSEACRRSTWHAMWVWLPLFSEFEPGLFVLVNQHRMCWLLRWLDWRWRRGPCISSGLDVGLEALYCPGSER